MPASPFSRRAFLAATGSSALSLGLSPSSFPAQAAAGADVDPDMVRVFVQTRQPRQTIEHFGASGCWTLDPIGSAWNDPEREQLAELLFSQTKGAGLSLFRFNFGAGDPNPQGFSGPWRRPACLQAGPGGPIDTDRQAGQFYFLQSAKRHGVEKTLAFTNSPPVWLTKNGRAFCDRNSGTTNLRPDAEHDFGRYLREILLHFQTIGLPFDYISPINEPNWAWQGGQEGCRYGNADIQRVLPILASELDMKHGVKAALRAPEVGILTALLDDADYRAYMGVSRPDIVCTGNAASPGKDREYLHDLLGDPAARAALGNHFLAHSYFTGDHYHDLVALRQAVRRNLDRYAPGAAFWQSEFCVMEHKRDLGMDTALRVAAVIHADLTMAEASSWSWWLAVSESDYKDGLIYTDFDHSGGGPHNILPSKILWTLGQWSRFVRPGARRVEIDTDALADDLLLSAFVGSSDGSQLTVVAVNPNHTSRRLRLAVDRPLRPLTPYVTDETRDLAALPAVSDGVFEVPGRSVVTLVEDSAGRARSLPLNAGALLSEQPPHRERKGEYVYVVECGARDGSPAPSGARRNSVADMPYGVDPGTGYKWGFVSYGKSGSRDDRSRAAAASPTDTQVVRWDDGDTPGKGLTYRFDVPAGRNLSVGLKFWDPWKNSARRIDVVVQGKLVEAGIVPGAEAVERRYTASVDRGGVLEVTVQRSADNADPAADPLLSGIRISEV